MLLIEGPNSLRELLESAETPADLAAVEELIAENESTRLKPSRWTVETLSEVAEVFGVAAQTAKQWRMESPPMPGSPGKWPIPEIIRWKLAKAAGGDITSAKRQQDLQLGNIQLQRQSIELAKERGQLIDAADVERWAAIALIEAREIFMSAPEQFALSAPPEQRDFIREEADKICRAALASLRRRLEPDQLQQQQAEPTE